MQEFPGAFDPVPEVPVTSATPPASQGPLPAPPIPAPINGAAPGGKLTWEQYQASGFNTSGTGPTAVLPQELQGFNWGAFLLNWIWAIAHNSWLGLLCFVPYIGIIMMFVLGFKGNEWAWQNRKWDSIDQFRATQQVWTTWGIWITVLSILFSCLCFMLLIVLARGM